mgnify:CR=1 FL=1
MVLCPNCHCEIDDSKIFLHERFCVQNIKYCELCQEGIIIEDYEEHCQNHKNLSKGKSKSNESKESRDSLTLQRVESSKIGCQYCGFLCGYKELEEHEVMCGSRTTKCSQCGQTLLIKNVKDHLEKLHKIKMDDYQNINSGDLCGIKTNSDSSTKFGNLNNVGLKRMTTDEEIAYALALSQEEEQERKHRNQKSEVLKRAENEVKNDFQREEERWRKGLKKLSIVLSLVFIIWSA